MFFSSNDVASILVVCVLCPYYCVMDLEIVLYMHVASSCNNAFELARGKRVGCILGGSGDVLHASVGVWRFVGRKWCVSFVQGRVCVSNREV